MVGASFQQLDPEFPLEALQLLAEGGLDDVLTLGRPTEMQLLGQGHEILHLAKLDPASTSTRDRGVRDLTMMPGSGR